MKKKLLSVLLVLTLILTVFPIGAKAEAKPKNVIYLIGDGMGQNHVQLTQWYWQGPREQLYIQNMPVLGYQTNYSANNGVTDSAASGTALACGLKTNNNVVGQSGTGEQYNNLMAVAKSQGMATGIISTAAITDATPAAFSAHVSNRSKQTEIAAQQAASGIDVIMGGGRDYYSSTLLDNMKENGYTYVSNREEMNVVPNDGKIIGLFTGGNMTYAYPTHETEPTIVEMTEKAIAMLKSRSSEGFALMVEGACIDKASHSNLYERMVEQNKLFDDAVKAALDFAREDGNTLVVVTADHETGGNAILPTQSLRSGRTKQEWTSGNHSGAHIPVYAYGPDAEVFTGMYDNTDIVKKISAFLGFTSDMWGYDMTPGTEPGYETGTQAKNVIYVLGSGMGQNQLHYTQLFYKGSYEWMNIQKLPVVGLMSTYSANNGTTDSVAAGAALATGRKSKNGETLDRDNFLDIAQSFGKKTGIVTDANLTGETLQSFVPKAELDVSDENSADLSSSVEQALADLQDAEKGFTLVVESDAINQYAKANDSANMMAEIKELDDAVGVAMEFAKEDGNTMVIVTADHETGSLVLPDSFSRQAGKTTAFQWHSKKASPTNVPVYAYGPASAEFTGVYDNTDLFYKVANVMGASIDSPGKSSVMGDINLDTKVTAVDALLVLKHVTGSQELTARQKAVADMDGRNGINVNDILIILQHAVTTGNGVEEIPYSYINGKDNDVYLGDNGDELMDMGWMLQ